MPEQTDYYELELPIKTEKYNIKIFNDNFKDIANRMKANADAIETKQPKIESKSAIFNVLNTNLPFSRVTVTDANGKITTCKVTVTEIEHLSGVTDNVQTQLNNKAASVHTHDDRYYTEAEIDRKLENKQNKLTIDSTLSDTSTNPVQNQAVTKALSNKSPIDHNHDSRYYTEAEVDDLLSGKLGKNENAVSSTKATQDSNGNKIIETYATKTELSNGLATKQNKITVSTSYPSGGNDGDLWAVYE